MRPRADWVVDGIVEYSPQARRLIDISPHGRPLLNAIAQSASGLTELVAAGVTADLEGAGAARVRVQPTGTAELPALKPADVIVAVDVLDRAADPRTLVRSLEQSVAPGGVIFVTSPVCGFEVQTLWDRSPTILPPDKLNIPTVRGLLRCFAAPVWEVLELSTPGMFDVETIRHVMNAHPDKPWPRAVRTLIDGSDAADHGALVEFLQSRRLTFVCAPGGAKEPLMLARLIKEKIRRGEPSIGSWMSMAHPSIAEILAMAGYDWVVVETEHTAIDVSEVFRLIIAIEQRGSIPLVRLAWNDPIQAKAVLDSGAAGVLVPMVNTRADAELAVRMTKYPPLGERGVGLARAQGYGECFDEYVHCANNDSLLMVIIEHKDAVANIDEVLSVPGIDGAFIGPYDLLCRSGFRAS